jgi:tetratricopeptide (TPR) repeat protein
VLDRMLADKKAYGITVYISTGEALLAASEFKLSEKAFSAVPLNAERPVVERALFGKAAALFGQAQFEECFQTLEKLLIKYPTSGHFYDARLMQARALVQLGRTDEAVATFGEVVAAKQDYSIAFEMAQHLSDPEAQLAAYQRIALLADPAKEENQPLIADSLVASLPLCIALQRYQLVLDSCGQFENLFPQHEQLPIIGKYRKEAEHALVQ